MAGRKYSVSEIDEMRFNIRRAFGPGSYYEAERAAAVEDRLRTHMQNGTDPEELRDAADQRMMKEYQHLQEMQANT